MTNNTGQYDDLTFDEFINAIENKHVLWMAETELRKALQIKDFAYIGFLAYECSRTWFNDNISKE